MTKYYLNIRFFTFSFLLFTFLVFSTAAQTSSVAEQNLRKHVGYLASDELEGRRTGEKGATVAAGYVTNMFTRYKLKGGVKKGKDKKGTGFLQPFPFIAGVALGDGNVLKLSNTSKISDAAVINDWAPLGLSPNGDFAFTNGIYGGYGIVSERLKYDDYAGIDISGKIVLAFAGNPDPDNPHSFFGFFNPHAKAKIAKEKGAKALILISRADNFADDKLAMRFNQTLGETSIPTIVISRQLAAKVLGVSADELKAEEGRLQKIAKGESAKREFRAKSLVAQLKVNLKKKKVDAYNVVGVLEGRDPVLRKEYIVIGAHYDHLGRGGSGSLAPNSNSIHNGADDNASGTSALIEIARRFAKSRSNKRTIIFMAFGGEEEGLLGSKYWVNNPTVPIERVVAMFNMDMIGRLNNKKLTVGGIGTAASWEKLVRGKNVAKPSPEKTATIQKVKDERVPAAAMFNLQLNQDGFGPSDHSSFYGKKIPVLFFFTGTHTDYHKPSDDADKVNYAGLVSITGYVESILKAVDSNAQRPVYKVAKSSGLQGGRRGFRVSLGTVPSYADGNNDGLVLDAVRNDTPASKAGLKAGDKITKLAGKEIRNISDYVFVLGTMKPDKEYEVVVVRGEETLTFKIVPKKR